MAKLYKQLKTSHELHHLTYQNSSPRVEPPGVEVTQVIDIESLQATAYQQGYQEGMSDAQKQSTQEIDELKQQLNISLSAIPKALIAQRN